MSRSEVIQKNGAVSDANNRRPTGSWYYVECKSWNGRERSEPEKCPLRPVVALFWAASNRHKPSFLQNCPDMTERELMKRPSSRANSGPPRSLSAETPHLSGRTTAEGRWLILQLLEIPPAGKSSCTMGYLTQRKTKEVLRLRYGGRNVAVFCQFQK